MAGEGGAEAADQGVGVAGKECVDVGGGGGCDGLARVRGRSARRVSP